jgi:hypothetical protein
VAVRTFALIDEAEARRIEPGTTVALEAGGHVTPLARDTLRERRVSVVSLGSVDAALPADLAPAAVIARVAIAADHTGQTLKVALMEHLRREGRQVNDLGPTDDAPADYPDTAGAVARAVARGQADAGIAIDGAAHRPSAISVGPTPSPACRT